MALLEKLAGPLMAAIKCRLQLGADPKFRRFLFDERIRLRLCPQIEVVAASHSAAGALDVEPSTNDENSAAFRERYDWISKHWPEVENLAAVILGGNGER